jgi:hypothetical protein
MQIKTLLYGAGHGEVSAMNRVESAAEQSDVQIDFSFPFSVSSFKRKSEG